MADQLGTVQIPALATDAPLGDPFLGYLLGFYAQALTNALADVWAVAAPNVPVVRTTDARDPSTYTLTTTELPALFIDRMGWDETVWEATDYGRVPSRLRLWWVLPRLELKWRRQRSNITNAAYAALAFGTDWTGRVPGYVVPGDLDPVAASKGSLIWKYAKIWSLDFKKGGPQKLVIDLGKEGKQTFDAVVWNIDCSERLTNDITQRSAPLAGLTDSVADDGLPLISISAQLRASSITPSSGTHLGGTPITIYGTQFVDGLTVSIGGTLCDQDSPGVSADGTNITATTPPGTVGARDVVVTNPGGETVTMIGAFTFT
ncbi:MAG TPA: IPT/TIG domain-containing protein [Polyangiaceae bacterium]|jgi:hypothetical protein